MLRGFALRKRRCRWRERDTLGSDVGRETKNTHSRLQFGDLIPGSAQLLQHLVQLVLHALTIHPFILKVLGRQLDLWVMEEEEEGGRDEKRRYANLKRSRSVAADSSTCRLFTL